MTEWGLEFSEPATQRPEPAVPPGRYVLANIGPDGRVIGYLPFIDGIPQGDGAARLVLLDHGQIVAHRDWIRE